MKIMLSIIAGLLILACFLSWNEQSPDWVPVETNSPHIQQSVRMAGTTLQIKHMYKNDTGKETAVITNGISGPK
ncbi:hypothetical protein AAGG74_12245 [Bacillus mexicanus]|uniref:hypothetical protein n=1 Tax=Bacillus TaxID=1386 RepID=UPI00138A4601|nr:hypothetical protein BTW01_15790 [Bacillus sp. SKDU12]